MTSVCIISRIRGLCCTYFCVCKHELYVCKIVSWQRTSLMPFPPLKKAMRRAARCSWIVKEEEEATATVLRANRTAGQEQKTLEPCDATASVPRERLLDVSEHRMSTSSDDVELAERRFLGIVSRARLIRPTQKLSRDVLQPSISPSLGFSFSFGWSM